MLVEAIVLALVFGLIFGGKLKNLEKIKLRNLYFAFIGFFIEYLSGLLIHSENDFIANWFNSNSLTIQVLVYTCIGIFFIRNIEYFGMKFLAVGSFLNFLVIAFNNGLMPVKTDLALRLGYYESVKALGEGSVFGHKVLDLSQDLFIGLADIIDIPKPYFFPKTISVGDIVIGFGAFFIIFLNMFYSKNDNNPI